MIINRALVVTLATTLVAVGYVLVVVAVGLVVDGGTTGFWPSLLATAVVALAFQPLRSRVVRIADRLAFGAAAAPYEALADFSRRLGESPDPTELLPSVAEAAGRAVRARRATVVLEVDAGPDLSASWPAGAADNRAYPELAMPVLHLGERLGTVSLAMPAGQPLRPRELGLLADLADQAGLAFRNARLTAELSGQVDQLTQRTVELDNSRRRLISASDAERSRLEQAIARQVVPHLQPLPDRLAELSSPSSAATGADAAALDPLVISLNTAVEALREITRGVFPAQLARSGLPTAVSSLLARTASTHRLVVEDSAASRRFDPRVEAAAYSCVAEAIRYLGEPVLVVLAVEGDRLRVAVSGREDGALPLSHIRDRVEATGGSVSTDCQEHRVELEAWLPLSHGAVSPPLPRPRAADPVRTPTW